MFHPCPIAPRLKFPLCHLLAVGLQTNPLPPPTSVFSSIKWYLHHRAAVRIIWDDTPEHYAQRGDGTCRRSWGSTVSGGPKSIPLEALLLPTAPRSPPSTTRPTTRGRELSLSAAVGGLGGSRERAWPALSPAPSAPCQAVGPTFLGFLKTIILCEPLSIGHVDVILKLGVLLTQGEGLGEGANTGFRTQPPPPP